jgi:succinoglycan biosynthesis protein ExoM
MPTGQSSLIRESVVEVCILTYRRPHSLRRLLLDLGSLSFRTVSAPRLGIIVVDNDPLGSARSLAESSEFRDISVRYVHEPNRGIPQARNKALESIGAACDFIVFIDDDERPTPQWLEALIATQACYAADVVVGPVIPMFEHDVPEWMRPAFERTPHATGDLLNTANAGNVLIARTSLQRVGLRFDNRLALAGGEDTLFFRRFAELGATMVWSNEAVVFETVPPSRTTLRWLLRRAFRTGSTWSTVERQLKPAPAIFIGRIGRSLLWMIIGCAQIAYGVVKGRAVALDGARRVVWAVGCLAGLLGIQYEEYRQLHGG